MEKETPEQSCKPKDSEKIFNRLKQFVTKNDLEDKIRVSKSYCQGLCSQGPIVSEFPDNIYYKEVSIEDVEEIIKNTLSLSQNFLSSLFPVVMPDFSRFSKST